MARLPTFWKTNTAKADGIAYSSSVTAYSSSSASYSSSTVASDEFAKTPATWTRASKTGTVWLGNTAAVANLYAFDSALRAYDSTTDSYDGTTTDNEPNNMNSPTLWSAA